MITHYLQSTESSNLHNLSASSKTSWLSTLSERQEDAIPARIINPGEDRTIYEGSTIETFTMLEADTLA